MSGREVLELEGNTPSHAALDLFEISPDPCMILTPEFTIQAINPAWQELMGVLPGSVLGSSVHDWMEPTKEAEEACLALVGARESTVRADCRMRAATGGRIIEWHAKAAPEGILCVGRDVTQQRSVQAKYLRSEERYRRILETSQEGIWFVDLDATTTYVNPRMAEIVGYQVVDMIGRPIFDFVPESQFEQVRTNLERRRAGLGDTFEFVYLHKSGRHIQCLVSASPIFNEDGVADGGVGMVMDISDRAEAAERLAELNHDLERRVLERTRSLQDANDELESFCYTVSHDLRAPLRSLVGFSQLVARRHRDALPREAMEHLKIIEDSAVDMSALVESLLRLSRLGRQAVKARDVDVASIVRRAIEDVSKGPTVATDFCLDVLPGCRGDPLLIHEIFTNLLSNAVKFSRTVEQPRVSIRATVELDMITYHIQDNGVGFNPKYSDRLWGVFQRLHRADEFEGTGAGLAIVKRIVERQGGRVRAQSELGSGATFSVSLPRCA